MANYKQRMALLANQAAKGFDTRGEVSQLERDHAAALAGFGEQAQRFIINANENPGSASPQQLKTLYGIQSGGKSARSRYMQLSSGNLSLGPPRPPKLAHSRSPWTQGMMDTQRGVQMNWVAQKFGRDSPGIEQMLSAYMQGDSQGYMEGLYAFQTEKAQKKQGKEDRLRGLRKEARGDTYQKRLAGSLAQVAEQELGGLVTAWVHARGKIGKEWKDLLEEMGENLAASLVWELLRSILFDKPKGGFSGKPSAGAVAGNAQTGGGGKGLFFDLLSLVPHFFGMSTGPGGAPGPIGGGPPLQIVTADVSTTARWMGQVYGPRQQWTSELKQGDYLRRVTL
jgi:hypothetical protein